MAAAGTEVQEISYEQLIEANAAASNSLDPVLDLAFDSKGLGLLRLRGGDNFREQVRKIQANLLPLAPQLAKQPQGVLDLLAESKDTRNVNGYSRGIDGHRSGLYFHPALDDPISLAPQEVSVDQSEIRRFYAPTRWPDETLPQLKKEARSAASFLVEVGRQLAQLLDRRLSRLNSSQESSSHDNRSNNNNNHDSDNGPLWSLAGREASECNHKCRLICYHEYDSEEQRSKEKGVWAAPHKDTGLFTLLVPQQFYDLEGNPIQCPDPEVGLYVRNRQGAICRIAAPEDEGEHLLFQLGEAMQIVSGGQWHATEHCVRGPPRPLAGYTRSSLAVFFQPHLWEDLALPDKCTFQDVAQRAHDGLFRMFLTMQPPESRGMNFLRFCLREGF